MPKKGLFYYANINVNPTEDLFQLKYFINEEVFSNIIYAYSHDIGL